jgi:glycosyltransferase involved in cell wall biosynthesis
MLGFLKMKKSKKILFIVAGLNIGGGVEQSVLLVANKLAQTGHDVEILTFYKNSNTYKIDPKVKVKSLGYKYSPSYLQRTHRFFIAYPRKIKKYVSKKKYDVIIGNEIDGNLVALILKRFYLKNIKTWIVVRNGNLFRVFYLYRKLSMYLMKFVNEIITVSNSLMFQYKGLGYKSTTRIYNPIDLKEVLKKKEEKLSDSEKKYFDTKCKYLFFAGKYGEQKNLFFMIDALKLLVKRNNNLKLVIMGKDGGQKKEILKYVKDKGLSDQFIDLGLQSNVFKFYKYADVFVLPSKYEGFSRVVLEAIACGVPVVANNCYAGPSEILDDIAHQELKIKDFHIGKWGLLTKYNDVKAFCRGIDYMLNNKALREKYKKEGPKRAKDFEIDKIIVEWEKMLSKQKTI